VNRTRRRLLIQRGTLGSNVLALIFGFNSADTFREFADEVVNVRVQAEVNAFDSVPVVDVEAFVIK
jgi:hypothetical protein